MSGIPLRTTCGWSFPQKKLDSLSNSPLCHGGNTASFLTSPNVASFKAPQFLITSNTRQCEGLETLVSATLLLERGYLKCRVLEHALTSQTNPIVDQVLSLLSVSHVGKKRLYWRWQWNVLEGDYTRAGKGLLSRKRFACGFYRRQKHLASVSAARCQYSSCYIHCYGDKTIL